MKNSIKTFSIIIALGLLSCANAEYESSEDQYEEQSENASAAYEETAEMDMAYEVESESAKKDASLTENHQQAISSVAATMINDSTMRFIRKATLKYKTESVRNTTYYLENAVVNLGGIVTYTNLYSEIENEKKIAVSNDSSLKITTYQMKNSMTIRIPNYQLDSLLKIISKSVVFLDERTITANEISLTELANQLEQNRMANYQSQLMAAIGGQKDQINKVVDAYENMLHKQKLEDDALIRNLELDYEVEYSTVQLNIYQDTKLEKELVENELNIEEYEPSFYSNFTESLHNGWTAILTFIVIIANFWFILIPIIIGLVIYKRRKVKNQD